MLGKRQDNPDQPNQTRTNSRTNYTLDRHLAYVKETPSIWLLPVGALAVGLRFQKEISDYVGLVKGLVGKILDSVIGRYKHANQYQFQMWAHNKLHT